MRDGSVSLRDYLQRNFVRVCAALRLPQEGNIIVACSGGADSAAALTLLRHAAPRARITACYVDHKLRSRAAIDRDIAAVREQANFAGAQVRVRTVDRKPEGTSLEAKARLARYATLAKAARAQRAAFVVTGHHADDVAETLMLALARGSGLDGTAAMRAKRRLAPSVTLVRPLLFATRAELLAFVRALGLPVSEDETNKDTRFRRNFIRSLLAQLESAVPGARLNLARSAQLLRSDKSLLDRQTAQAFEGCKDRKGSVALSAQALRALRLPLLRRVIRHALKVEAGNARDFSLQQCSAIAHALKARRGGAYRAGSHEILLSAGRLRITQAGKRGEPGRSAPAAPFTVRLKTKGRLKTPAGTLTFQKAGYVARKRQPSQRRSQQNGSLLLDYDALRDAHLHVRWPRSGDKCTPSGRRSPVSLARFLAKAGVPRTSRDCVPLLCAETRIAAALGVRVMEPFAPKPGASVLEVRWQSHGKCR